MVRLYDHPFPVLAVVPDERDDTEHSQCNRGIHARLGHVMG